MRLLPALLLPLALTLTPKSCQHAPDNGSAAEHTVANLTVEQGQEAAANVQAAREANATAQESPAKSATEGSLDVAADALPVPTPKQLEAARAPMRLALAGDLEAARAGWDKAKGELAVLRDRLAEAVKQRERERTEAERARLQAIAEAKRAAQAEAAHYLNLGGALAAGVFALCAVFGGLTLLQRGAWVLLLLSLLAFGLAQVVSQDWFKWAVLAATGIACGAFAWHNARTSKAVSAQRALSPVVRALDDAYDNGTVEQRALLDTLVFNPLSSDPKMSDADRAAIHQIRADAKCA